ncbi:MAG: hopanoid biosynthesis-associated protein HpnK [Acetobacteraceae bacterium]
MERAHREGVLSTASLMVSGQAAADAVRRAKRLPGLGVGLHLVVIEGPAVLPDSAPDRQFGSDQLRLGVDYFFRPAARRRLAAEITAQYRAFAATGLALDHANAHKHMHLHPTVGGLLVETGRAFGLRALRIPAEPPAVMQALGVAQGVGARALHVWTRLLRRQGRRAGLRMNDQVFGLAWSGRMTRDRLLRLATKLPPGLSEIYFHPATKQNALLARLMPGYDHEGELAALLDPEVGAALRKAATLTGWQA